MPRNPERQVHSETSSPDERAPSSGCRSLWRQGHEAVIRMTCRRLKSPPVFTVKISLGSGRRRGRATCRSMPRTFSIPKARPVGRGLSGLTAAGEGQSSHSRVPSSSHLTKRRRYMFLCHHQHGKGFRKELG